MKQKAISFYYITLMIICQCLAVIIGVNEVFAVDVNNFYFDDFTGDYYLSKDAEGVSKLRVVESVTAVFPDYRQNKGICRQIPFTNQGGINVVLPDLSRNNITVTRNGVSEPIYSIERDADYYNVCTGTEEYVLGRQTYVFEYEFEKVVTQFDGYQELYWDTNGNGATQKFNMVTARLHFANNVADSYSGKAWCYVGSYGENGQERCEISEISDGVQFQAQDLNRFENLTFDVELKDGAFVVPEPTKDYTLVWIMVGTGAIMVALLVVFPVRKFLKNNEKRKYYKNFFVKPEYQPHREYSMAEMAEVYIGKKKEPKVAVMLDMIVNKKIAISKTGEAKRKGWMVKVLSMDNMRDEEKTLLSILNGGLTPEVGEEIEVKSRAATNTLVSLGHKYNKQIMEELENDGLFETAKNKVGSSSSVVLIVFVLIIATMVWMPSMFDFLDGLTSRLTLTGRMVGSEIFVPVMIVIFVATIVAWSVISSKTAKYSKRTLKGLEMSRYMDGLELYIKMAETDRLKFLQSVNGARVSNDGIIKLYEKLLPYAALFGLEESWMKELEKYYKLDESLEPDWYRRGISMHDMYYMSRLASSTVQASTTMASSGGSSSSGFSGGGGGGFSGGGGGGGGFSGR
ncbi:DUF2207 domain-containing protein [Candidatus Saccharibacteria bacterium]|nr:DUF2207 domain-containing protein [Candidatus Saccharibacteria bacterium]